MSRPFLRLEFSVIVFSLASSPVLAAGNSLLAEGAATSFATSMLLPLLVIGVLFWVMILRPEKRRSDSHKSLLDNLKKNDRVVTIGGIRGTVLAVNKEADEIVLKVDENTKLRMTFGSIARVEDSGKGEPAKGEAAAP